MSPDRTGYIHQAEEDQLPWAGGKGERETAAGMAQAIAGAPADPGSTSRPVDAPPVDAPPVTLPPTTIPAPPAP